jgi:hypothetical protein
VFRFGGNSVADQVGRTLAVGGGNTKTAGRRWNEDQHFTGADQLTQASGDELEDAGYILPLLEDAVC